MADYGEMLNRIGGWFEKAAFPTPVFGGKRLCLWRRTWFVLCRRSARCVASAASKSSKPDDHEGPVHCAPAESHAICFRRCLNYVHAEEPAQVHDRLRRDAEQDRRLSVKLSKFLTVITQFGGYYICLSRRIWSSPWPRSAKCWMSSALCNCEYKKSCLRNTAGSFFDVFIAEMNSAGEGQDHNAIKLKIVGRRHD